jgi:ribosomal subunit interface protein
MQLQIKGHHVDIGEALTGYVKTVLGDITSHKFPNSIEGTVIFSRERYQFVVEITLHPAKNIILQTHAAASDAYTAFDMAADKIRKRLFRYSEKIIDKKHHQPNKAHPARQYVLKNEDLSQEPVTDETQPTIIAEMETHLSDLTVSEAVMQLDLSDSPTLIFKNKAHGRLNVIYRRPDGNIGWIDPNQG